MLFIKNKTKTFINVGKTFCLVVRLVRVNTFTPVYISVLH